MPPDSNGRPSDDLAAQLEEVSQELRALSEYSPSTLTEDPLQSVNTDVPLWLYDKHLDAKLNLLHVKSLSTLPGSLAAVVDEAVASIAAQGIRLPPTGRSFPGQARRQARQPQVTDAPSVASYYKFTTALSCETFASMLAVHPRAPSWMTSLHWDLFPEWVHSWSWENEYSLRIQYNTQTKVFYLSPKLHEFLDDQTLEDLKNAATRLPDMATWLIGPVSRKTQDTLRDMDKFISPHDFKSQVPSTTGLLPNRRAVLADSPDATSSPWEIDEQNVDDPHRTNRSPSEHPSSGPRRSARLQGATKTSGAPKGPHPSSTPQHNLGRRSTVTPEHQFAVCPGTGATPLSEAGRLLQHAWTQSVRKDTTLIIFHCGNFERIGIRHRKSQTLYLSDLIDVANTKSPSYGKLHLGLYISAFRDTLDRAAQLRDLEMRPLRRGPAGTKHQHLKRKAEDNPISSNKHARQKVDTTDTPSHDIDDVFHEAGLRDLALFQFQYGVFNSTSLSSFLRVEGLLSRKSHPRLHRKYLPKEYFRISIFSSIGSGSTGISHSAKLDLKTSNHRPMACDVVVKFAFTDEQQRRMRHEYSIYSHLATSGVAGVIVRVLGLFKDVEGGSLALIMTHGGVSLEERVQMPASIEDRKSERTAFLRAVESIHNAGVRHDDLGAANLLVNESGGVTILDFDLASLDASEGTRRHELKELRNFLDELYGLESDIISGTSTTSSEESSGAGSTETVGGS